MEDSCGEEMMQQRCNVGRPVVYSLVVDGRDAAGVGWMWGRKMSTEILGAGDVGRGSLISEASGTKGRNESDAPIGISRNTPI